MSEQRCAHCGAVVRVINYAMGPEVMHVDPHAGFPTEHKGSAWRYCRLQVAALAAPSPSAPMNAETGGGLTELREAVATRLDDLNACGYLVYPHPNTGEPMQEQVPVDYLADAVMDIIASRADGREAMAREVRAVAPTDRDAVLARVEGLADEVRAMRPSTDVDRLQLSRKHREDEIGKLAYRRAINDVLGRLAAALHPAPSEAPMPT